MACHPFWIGLYLLLCFSMTGCGGPSPLTFRKNRTEFAPWCGPHQRVKIGQRVVGHVHDGPKYKDFLVDDTGKEYDPEKIADQAWSYLERTGDANEIEDAFSKDAYQAAMSVVSINPVLVILTTYQDTAWLKEKREFAYQRWYWRAQIQPNSDPPFRAGLQWFSPDLKQQPITLPLSSAGVAEILLPNGKLKLIRAGDKCRTTRE